MFRKNSRNSRYGLKLAPIGSIFLIILAGIASAQDITIDASVDRNRVAPGESINLTISLSGPVRSIAKPDLPDLSDFDIYSSGTSSNISIVPGSVSYHTDYSYVLVPRRAGKFIIGPVKVEHEGKLYQTNPIVITVEQPGQPQQRQPQQQQPQQQQPQQQQPQQQQQAPPQTQNRQKSSRQSSAGSDFFIEQVVDKARPYVGQQITLIFRFYQGENLYEQPSLKWPALNGFWVEDLPPNRTYNKQVGGRTYRVTEIRKALFPTITGRLRIEPTVMTIPPQAFFDNFFGRDPFDFFNRRRPQKSLTEQVLDTKGITINVRGLPERNKPDYFSGAVGTFSFRVSLDKDTVEVDQPITLKAIISGTGNIKKLPAIEIPETENFRLYDSGSNENISKSNYKVTGSKSFEWVLIPTAPGDYMLPELKFAYFDPWSKSYKSSIQTPGMVHVTASTMTSNAPGDRPVNVIPAATRSLNYIVTSLSNNDSGKPLYSHTWIWLIQILPLAWLIGLAVYVNNRKRLEGDVAYARRKLATRAARKALKEAREGFDSPEKFYANIYNGIVGFISDKLNIQAAGMTNMQIIKLLEKTGKCDNIINDFEEFLKQCDAGRFSPMKPGRSEMQKIYDRAERLLSELDRGLR
jgi:hypothetical protein